MVKNISGGRSGRRNGHLCALRIRTAVCSVGAVCNGNGVYRLPFRREGFVARRHFIVGKGYLRVPVVPAEETEAVLGRVGNRCGAFTRLQRLRSKNRRSAVRIKGQGIDRFFLHGYPDINARMIRLDPRGFVVIVKVIGNPCTVTPDDGVIGFVVGAVA